MRASRSATRFSRDACGTGGWIVPLDRRRLRPQRRERRRRMIAPQRARPGPEQLGDRAHAARWRGAWLERRGVRPQRLDPVGRHRRVLPMRRIAHLPAMRRHHQRPRRSEHVEQRHDHADRTAGYPADRAQRRMDEKYVTRRRAERPQIGRKAQRCARRRRLRYGIGFTHFENASRLAAKEKGP